MQDKRNVVLVKQETKNKVKLLFNIWEEYEDLCIIVDFLSKRYNVKVNQDLSGPDSHLIYKC